VRPHGSEKALRIHTKECDLRAFFMVEIGCGGAAKARKLKTRVALDSGAYSAFSQNKSIEIDAYIEFVIEHQHLLEVYFNLDVIGDGEQSYQNWVYMRSKGLDPVPVYHTDTNIKYLEIYLREADYIAIGAIANIPNSKRMAHLKRVWSNHLLDSIGYPRAKFHGFGLTSPPLVAAFPWHSVDSSSWVKSGGKYAICLIPKPKQSCAGYSYDQSPIRVSVTTRSAHRKNHIEKLLTYPRLQILQYIEERGFKLGRGDPGDSDFEPGLSNDGTMRDQLNAIFYAEMGLALGKPAYIAGSFTALSNPEVEKRIQQRVFALSSNYYRMISFADYPKIQTVLDLKRKELRHERRERT
jgi:hypothetical protein